MNTVVLTIFANTLALAWFCQSAIRGISLTIGRRALVPPTAPETILKHALESKASPNAESENSTRTEAQIAIANAVLPSQPLEEAPKPSTPSKANGGCSTAVFGECGTGCYRFESSKFYTRTIPYLSNWLLTAQALLGIGTTLSMLIWHLFEIGSCSILMRLTLVCFHIGFSLLMLASAVQTHTTNDMCIKIFFIMLAGFSVHFTMLGLVLANGTAVWHRDPGLGICLLDVEQPNGWLRNLPMYSAASHFLVCFFSTISIINASFRLCLHTRFLSPRELSFVLFVYRGLGLLFLNGLTGTLLSTAVIAVASFGHFHYSPYWVLQWAVMSRIVSAALWHRANTDPWAPKHPFWTSDAYVYPPSDLNPSGDLGYEKDGSSSNQSPAVTPSSVHTLLGMSLMCHPKSELALSAQPAHQDTAVLPHVHAAVMDERCYRGSRHDTVVAGIHCGSCSCLTAADPYCRHINH
ncbi:hypothetical protein GQ54DRAFT_295296 [Martensiomyces pterosporus]|nr:hypothetical protein GQ54DRAFT_295296 [Martensiomyces pterosporus]